MAKNVWMYGLEGIADNVELGKGGNRMINQSGYVELKNNANSTLIRLKILDAVNADEAITKSQLDAAVTSMADALTYEGTFDASAGNWTALDNAGQGDLYKVSVAGTIGTVEMAVNDIIIVNKDVTGTPVDADIDKIDNTEAADILRTGDISTDGDFTVDPSKIAYRSTIKTFVDAAIVAALENNSASRTAALAFGSSSTVNIGNALSPSGVIKRGTVAVTQEFDGTTESTLKIGYTADDDSIAVIDEINLHAVGQYDFVCRVQNTAQTQYFATYVADGATQGTADIDFEYIMP